jgi:hypothetical protein
MEVTPPIFGSGPMQTHPTAGPLRGDGHRERRQLGFAHWVGEPGSGGRRERPSPQGRQADGWQVEVRFDQHTWQMSIKTICTKCFRRVVGDSVIESTFTCAEIRRSELHH